MKKATVMFSALLALVFMFPVFVLADESTIPSPNFDIRIELTNMATNETYSIQGVLDEKSVISTKSNNGFVVQIEAGVQFEDNTPIISVAPRDAGSKTEWDSTQSCSSTVSIRYSTNDIYKRLDFASASWSLVSSSVRCLDKSIEFAQGGQAMGGGTDFQNHRYYTTDWSCAYNTNYTKYINMNAGSSYMLAHSHCTLDRGGTQWAFTVTVSA